MGLFRGPVIIYRIRNHPEPNFDMARCVSPPSLVT